MTSSTSWKSILFVAAIALTQSAHAVKPGEEEKKECRKPKFRDFAPVHLAEVAPETALIFHVSRGAEPASVTIEAKGEKLPVTVVDRVNFLAATARLPATLQEGFVRIHVTAAAIEGGCIGQDGWLLKINPAASAAGDPAVKPAAMQ